MSVAITPLFLELHHVFVVDDLEVSSRHQITFVFCEPALDDLRVGVRCSVLDLECRFSSRVRDIEKIAGVLHFGCM